MHVAILGRTCVATVAAMLIDVCKKDTCAFLSHFKKSAVVVPAIAFCGTVKIKKRENKNALKAFVIGNFEESRLIQNW